MSRALGLVGFVLAAAAVGALAVRSGPGSDRPTLAPAVELVGRTTQTVDRAAAQALGVGIKDERRLGDQMHPLLAARSVGGEDEAYVRAVLAEITPLARKPLVWQAYLIADPSPNAMAFPGGAIAVTTGLLRTLDAEDELAGVLAHEVAHVELSHGLDAAKYEIVSTKLGAEPLGEVAGWLERTLWRTSFDQSAEAEADRWAFEALVVSSWDPAGLARGFQHLAASAPAPRQGVNPMRDYLASHPPIAGRVSRYQEAARAWWAANPGATRWRGAEAYAARARPAVDRRSDPEPVAAYTPDG